MEKCHTLDIKSMWHKEWPRNIIRSVWGRFHGLVIMLYILKTIRWRDVIPWILVSCDESDLKVYVRQFDPYFLVQWLCLISKFLIEKCHNLDISSMWHEEWPQNICRSMWPYISWTSDYALYLDDYLIEKCHTLDISSIWLDGWSQNICMSMWPIFHGPVIIPHISKTIWCRNIIPWTLVPCDRIIQKIYVGQFDLHFTVK